MELFRKTTASRLLLKALLGLWLLFAGLHAGAQFYNGSQVTFGKNRVQYSDFFWTYFRYNNIDVYYYLNGKETARHVADYATRYIPALEKQLDNPLDKKIQFIIYNSFSDLKQSNLGLMNNMQYNTGGITHIIGSKVFVYCDGDNNHLEEQVRAGLARMLLENLIYGSSIGSQIKNNTLITLPDWYIEGLVSYYSRAWNTDLDDKMKAGILSGRYNKFNHLVGEDARVAGHSLWKYIADTYGKEYVQNIVMMTRVNRNAESGFLYTTGLPFKKTINQWLEYYQGIYKPTVTTGPAGTSAKLRTKRDRLYQQMHLSPDGHYLTYTANDHGLYKVFLKDLQSGKVKRIFKKGIRSDEKVDYSYPITAWHPNGGVLAMITEIKGQLYLYYYSLDTHQWEQQHLFGFQKVLDFTYSPDGRSFAFSAVQRGQSDIYLYNISANSAWAVTQDMYNDFNPCFLPGTSRIVFASNRPDDSIRQEPEMTRPYNGLPDNDLFVYNPADTRMLFRVARTPIANELQPIALGKSTFAYLSDANGTYNRYIGRLDSTVAFVDTTVHYRYFASTQPATNYPMNIQSYDYCAATQQVVESYVMKDRQQVMLAELNSFGGSGSGELKRSQLAEKRNQQMANETSANAAEEAKAAPARKKFVNVYKGVQAGQPDTLRVVGNNRQASGTVPLFKPGTRPTVGYLTLGEHSLMKPAQSRNYNVEFSVNELVSQLDFSYLNLSYQPYLGYSGPLYQNPPTNGLFTFGATDLMEDYRITGSVRLNSDLSNVEYLVGYAQLKHRLDREIYFHRSGYDVSYTDAYVRHRVHELHYIMRYPFSEVFALKSTFTVQHDNPIVLALDYASAQLNIKPNIWGIGKAELVYDNTRNLGTNLMAGTRYKIFGEYYQLTNHGKDNVNMIVCGFDLRHYTKIHRSFVWANRFAGSTSFGQSRLLYYMGGVDNWLFPKFNTEYQIDLTQNYAFQTLATNMRGFEQNVRSGNTFALLSSELRFPVFQYLFNKPLRYDFLNNFQVIGFTDLGSAWQGLNPLSDENTYYTKTIYQNPLLVTVKVQKDPLIAGYGFGLRSTLFGYFVRADWAWGIEDKVVSPRIFYLSLSLDF